MRSVERPHVFRLTNRGQHSASRFDAAEAGETLLQPGSPRRFRRTMTTMSMTAIAASTSSTAGKTSGASSTYNQIAKDVHRTKPNTARQSRNVRALMAGAAPPIPAAGSW
jgi:hypothetical protein